MKTWTSKTGHNKPDHHGFQRTLKERLYKLGDELASERVAALLERVKSQPAEGLSK